jgi:hypothetical protein
VSRGVSSGGSSSGIPRIRAAAPPQLLALFDAPEAAISTYRASSFARRSPSMYALLRQYANAASSLLERAAGAVVLLLVLLDVLVVTVAAVFNVVVSSPCVGKMAAKDDRDDGVTSK